MLFTLPQPLGGRAGADIINDYNGLVGFQYNLGAQTALRIGADLTRASCGDIKTTNTAGVESTSLSACIAGPTIPGSAVGGFNSHIGIGLSAEYLMRVSTAAISPYLGVGAGIGFDRYAFTGTPESGGVAGTEYKNRAYSFDLGIGGKLGLEWRVHKVIALFAEYQAGLTLIESTSAKRDETPAGGVNQTQDSKQKKYFNLDTGISNTGKLGVVAFF